MTALGAGMTQSIDLLARLEAAAGEGLAANLARFLAFLGWQAGEVLELQALRIPANKAAGRWRDTPAMAAHASSLPDTTRGPGPGFGLEQPVVLVAAPALVCPVCQAVMLEGPVIEATEQALLPSRPVSSLRCRPRRNPPPQSANPPVKPAKQPEGSSAEGVFMISALPPRKVASFQAFVTSSAPLNKAWLGPRQG